MDLCINESEQSGDYVYISIFALTRFAHTFA